MEFLSLIGRFHPLVLHIPIGIFVFVFFIEIYARFKKTDQYQSSISLGLITGTGFAILSCITGYLLAKYGDYSGETVIMHKRLSIAFTLLSAGISYLHYKNIGSAHQHKLYFPLLCAMMTLLLFTGHQGGSLTHGEGFLTKKKAKRLLVQNQKQAIAFEAIIQPILENKCVSCHNTTKTKGKLIMTSEAGLQRGGANGKLFIPGKAANSLMMQRIHLEVSDEDHMPPEGKSQLFSDEIALLNWWINTGASFTSKVNELPADDAIKSILSKYQSTGNELNEHTIEIPDQSVITDLQNEGIRVHQLSGQSPFVEVDFSHEGKLTKSHFRKLQKLADHVTQLNLAFTNMDDKLVKLIKKFPHLQSLQMQKTLISSKAVEELSDLKYLESLNLYGTQVDDQSLNILEKLPSLKTVYLWQTKIKEASIAQLKEARPLLDINYQIDKDIFGTAALKPPLIEAEKDLFKDSLIVSLALNFKNVDLHYTLDGSEPDSNSMLYTEPFVIDQTTKVKAISRKQGWVSSAVASRQFLQSQFTIADAQLTKPPHSKYKASGAKTLTDFVKGSEAFTDGNWLGYEKDHMTVTLDLGQKELISTVSVSALEAAGSWIFYPVSIKIWTSLDGNNYQLKKEESYPIASSIQPAQVKNFTEQFDPTEVRYVKVKVESPLVNPSWHPNPAGGCWIFVDEVVVN